MLTMPAPAVEWALEPAPPARAPVTSGRGGPIINPVTGLSTDYLNHFAEAVMVLEAATSMPECLEDLRGWRPKGYVEHFSTSSFSNREAVITAYEGTSPAVRHAIDRAAEVLNEALVKTRDIVLRDRKKPDAARAAQWAVDWIKPLIARTAAVINGTAPDVAERQGSQAAIDVIFKR
jgi:hypothetical protein